MDTPICDYVNQYCQSNALRLHMPGHKGVPILGMEPLDLTEIDGADSLYEAEGIIRRSEENASALFGCPTFYSTEGSSQCIRAMLYLAQIHAKRQGREAHILAARNVHKTFLSAAALLDLDVTWLYSADSYLACPLDADVLERAIAQMEQPPTTVYITSPDYLGNCTDIRVLAEVCHRHGALLLVDNAHGAYLRFLNPSRHPMDCGADLCCDSAHKTLPCLTGGAYLHLTEPTLVPLAKRALALFGSTSPSYLILQSLDAVNAYLAANYRQKLAEYTHKVMQLKQELEHHGYLLRGEEPLKICICAKPYGYTGVELAQCLAQENIICEFADPDFLVVMLTPEITELRRLSAALLSIPRRAAIAQGYPQLHRCERVMSIRRAALAPSQMLPIAQCVGRVCAAPSVGCPPAVPIVVCGERIDKAAVDCFTYYGIHSCAIVEE